MKLYKYCDLDNLRHVIIMRTLKEKKRHNKQTQPNQHLETSQRTKIHLSTMGFSYFVASACVIWLHLLAIRGGEAVDGVGYISPHRHGVNVVPPKKVLAFAPAKIRKRQAASWAFQQQQKILQHRSYPISRTVSRQAAAAGKTVSKEMQTPNVKMNPWKLHDAELLNRVYNRKRVPSSTYDKTTTEYDYIIIGSGIGGLWLAACLAKFNVTSLVLEQHYTAGGLQHEFTVKGYEFVPGLHYVANLDLVGPMYDMVASPTDPPLRWMRAGNCTPADAGECCSHDLAVGDMPVLHVREGLEQNRQELLDAFPDEADAIDEFLSYVEKAKFQSGIFSTLKICPPAIQWILSQFLCSSYIHTASRSTEEIIMPLTRDGRLHTVLSLFAGDLGESLGDGSFAMQAAVLGHIIEGCYYPESGPAQLVRGLVPTIRSTGIGDVLVKAAVKEILFEDGRAVGVKLADSGDCLYAKQGIVSDAGLDNTLENLVPRHLITKKGPLRKLYDEVKDAGKGAISHCFGFVGLNKSAEELGLRSSSYYYLPWNTTDPSMDATFIQDYYRDTLLDPNA